MSQLQQFQQATRNLRCTFAQLLHAGAGLGRHETAGTTARSTKLFAIARSTSCTHLRKLYLQAAAEDEKAMLLFDDPQPARLNDASHIINTGHVPGWIPLADKNALLQGLMPQCQQAGMASSLHDQLVFLNGKVHAHIHAVVCAGGAGNGLEKFYQSFPGENSASPQRYCRHHLNLIC